MRESPRVAILGAGVWSKEAHIPALVKLGQSVQLSAVWSRSKSSALSLASEATKLLHITPQVYCEGDGSSDNLDALLARSDIDGVIIAVPIAHQPALIKRAWAAGKSVASEKPVSGTVDVAEDLIETFKTNYEGKGLRWHVLENFVFESAYLEVKRLVSTESIGKISFFSYNVAFSVDPSNRFYLTEWRKAPEHEGGFLLDGGVHHSAALRLSLPSPVSEISARATLVRPFLAPTDTLHALIKLEDGTAGTFALSFGASEEAVREELVLVGEKGQIRLSAQPDGARQAGFTVETTKAGEAKAQSQFFPSDGVDQAIRYFAQAIGGKTTVDADERASPERALVDVRLVLAGLHSQGNAVTL